MSHRRLVIASLLSLTLLVVALLAPAATVSADDSGCSAVCLNDPNGPGCTAGLPTVEYQMLLDEITRTRPLSVVMAEDIAALRLWAKERTVAVD